MEPELKMKWLGELRSGKHQQAKGGLIDHDGGLCCLGVLHYVIEGKRPTFETWNYETNKCPTDVRINLDVSKQNVLANMNDGGRSFAEIADWIEKNL